MEGLNSGGGQEILLFSKSARRAQEPTQPSTQRVWWVKQLITHVHQMLSLMMVEIIPALPLYAFMAYIKLPFFIDGTHKLETCMAS